MKAISFNTNKINYNATMNLKNNLMNKPISCFWASPYLEFGLYRSSWERWCVNENFSIERDKFIVFNIKEEARIYIIDCFEDLRKLTNNYILINEVIAYKNLIDFEKVKNDYDVIYLTQKGEAETRYNLHYNLYGWDVECFLILNLNVIEEVV